MAVTIYRDDIVGGQVISEDYAKASKDIYGNPKKVYASAQAMADDLIANAGYRATKDKPKVSTSTQTTTSAYTGGTKLTQAARDRIKKSAKIKFGNLLTESMVDMYVTAYVDSGNDADEAIAVVRQSPEYQNIYAGNLNEDKATVKYTEAEYSQNIEAFGRKLEAVGVKADFMLTAERKKQLTENLVSPDEFGTRVNAVYTNIINSIPQVKDYYMRIFGRTLTDEEIIASAIDPKVGEGIISGTIASTDVISANITKAKIGAEALLAGTDITADVADQLQKMGLSVDKARRGFQQVRAIQQQAAAQGRAVMSVQDIIEGTELGQMEEMRAVQNIIRQTESESAVVLGAKTAQTGAVTGLVEQ